MLFSTGEDINWPRTRLSTVGIEHETNAVTADTIVTIIGPPIPAVSEWGVVVMALALLIVARVYFSRRNALRT